MAKKSEKRGSNAPRSSTRREFLKQAGKTAATLGAISVFPSIVSTGLAAERDYILIRHPNPSTGPVHLDYLVRRATAAQLTVAHHIRKGTPSTEIAELAGERGVDLIVIAQVGHRGPRRILIGNVTERATP